MNKVYLLQEGDVESCETIAAFDNHYNALVSLANFVKSCNRVELSNYYFFIEEDNFDNIFPGDDGWEDWMVDYEFASKENYRKYHEVHSYSPVTADYWERDDGGLLGWVRVIEIDVCDAPLLSFESHFWCYRELIYHGGNN